MDNAITISIVNTGMEPAITGAFTVRLDGKPAEGDMFRALEKAWDKLGLSKHPFHAYIPHEDEAFAVGEVQTLFVPILTKPSTEEIAKIRGLSRRITFSLKYKSIYGDKFPVEG